MKILVTRDSVAAGDDVDAPHSKEIKLPESANAKKIVSDIVKSGYLPRISGGKASWSVVSESPIAVVAQEWKAPKILWDADSNLLKDNGKINGCWGHILNCELLCGVGLVEGAGGERRILARPWRIEYEGAYYHVLSRGNERRDIFIQDGDRKLFLATLGETSERLDEKIGPLFGVSYSASSHIVRDVSK